MTIETRKRRLDDDTTKTDLLLLPQSEAESELLDAIAKTPDADGLIYRGIFEIRLSDGLGPHYVLLKSL